MRRRCISRSECRLPLHEFILLVAKSMNYKLHDRTKFISRRFFVWRPMVLGHLTLKVDKYNKWKVVRSKDSKQTTDLSRIERERINERSIAG